MKLIYCYEGRSCSVVSICKEEYVSENIEKFLKKRFHQRKYNFDEDWRKSNFFATTSYEEYKELREMGLILFHGHMTYPNLDEENFNRIVEYSKKRIEEDKEFFEGENPEYLSTVQKYVDDLRKSIFVTDADVNTLMDFIIYEE